MLLLLLLLPLSLHLRNDTCFKWRQLVTIWRHIECRIITHVGTSDNYWTRLDGWISISIQSRQVISDKSVNIGFITRLPWLCIKSPHYWTQHTDVQHWRHLHLTSQCNVFILLNEKDASRKALSKRNNWRFVNFCVWWRHQNSCLG